MTDRIIFVSVTLSPRDRGRIAFNQGENRLVPREILVDDGIEAARDWYRGWDAANLAAPWDT